MGKLFGVKTDSEELYFQLEKSLPALAMIDAIEYEIFGNKCGYEFGSHFQNGLPAKEDYVSLTKNKIFIVVITGKERVHIIIKGKVDKEKIKKMVSEKFSI